MSENFFDTDFLSIGGSKVFAGGERTDQRCGTVGCVVTEPVRTLDGDTLVLVHSNDNPDRRADVDGLTPPQYVGLAINAGSQSREVFVNTNFSKVDSGLYQLSTHTDAGSTARPKFMEVEVVKFQQDLVNKLSSTPEAARPAIRQPANVR